MTFVSVFSVVWTSWPIRTCGWLAVGHFVCSFVYICYHVLPHRPPRCLLICTALWGHLNVPKVVCPLWNGRSGPGWWLRNARGQGTGNKYKPAPRSTLHTGISIYPSGSRNHLKVPCRLGLPLMSGSHKNERHHVNGNKWHVTMTSFRTKRPLIFALTLFIWDQDEFAVRAHGWNRWVLSSRYY